MTMPINVYVINFDLSIYFNDFGSRPVIHCFRESLINYTIKFY